MTERVRWWRRRSALRGVGGWLCAFLLLQAGPASAGALERAMLGMSAIVDLTHPIAECSTPADQPRTDPSGGENQASRDGCGAGKRDFGTRLTLQATARSDRRTVARIPSHELLALAVVVSVAQKVGQLPEYQATVDDLRAWERKYGRIPKHSAVLLNTGWAARWIEPARYANPDPHGMPQVPGFSPAAVVYLVDERQVRGLGLDAFIPDKPVTRSLNQGVPAGVWWIENLDNLDRLPTKGAKLVIAPLRIEAVSAPVRVIAILP